MTQKRDMLALLSTGVLAQVVPLMALPILTIYFSPSQFGQLALAVGLSTILASLLTLRMELGLLSCKSIADHNELLFSCLLQIIAGTVLLTLIIGILGMFFNIPLWVWFVIPFAPVVAMIAVVSTVRNTGNQIARIGISRLIGALVNPTVAIMFYIIATDQSHATKGLLIGFISGQVVILTVLLWSRQSAIRQFHSAWKDFVWSSRIYHKYSEFPKYVLPANFLSSIYTGSLPAIVGLVLPVDAVGLFSIAHRLLSAPVNLSSFGALELYKNRSSQEFRMTGNCTKTFSQFASWLLAVGSVFVLTVLLIPKSWIVAILGSGYQNVGTLLPILVPMYALRFVASPLSFTFIMVGKAKKTLSWIFSGLAILSSILVWTYLKNPSIAYFGGILAWSFSLYYVSYLYATYKISRGS